MKRLKPGIKVISRSLALSAACLACSGLLLTLAACSGNNKKDSLKKESTETYHADNDIAMTIRSIADALNVGQQLDSTEYNFEGILTDGQGKPLYTDLTGSPGVWNVNVINPATASIRNTYLGDLLPDDLRQYIIGTLNLSDTDMLDNMKFEDAENTEVYIYTLGHSELRIITKTATSADGTEGLLMNVIISSPHA